MSLICLLENIVTFSSTVELVDPGAGIAEEKLRCRVRFLLRFVQTFANKVGASSQRADFILQPNQMLQVANRLGLAQHKTVVCVAFTRIIGPERSSYWFKQFSIESQSVKTFFVASDNQHDVVFCYAFVVRLIKPSSPTFFSVSQIVFRTANVFVQVPEFADKR